MTDENKGFEDGSTKVVHTAAESLKLNAVLKTKDGNPWKGNAKGLRMAYTDGYGPQTLQLHGGKFKADGLKIAANKAIWDTANALLPEVKEFMMDDDDEVEAPKVTITFTKKGGYWDATNLQKGHVGNAGTFKAGVDPAAAPSGGSGGGGYNPAGAIIGKIENWALEITIANKPAKGKVTLEDVRDTLKGFDADLVAEINELATGVYEEAYSNKKPAAKVNEPEEADDDDIPLEDVAEELDDVPY